MTHHDDYHAEPVPGLPARLPEGEHILWQGAPDRSSMARYALHTRKLAVYFGLLIVWKLVAGLSDGNAMREIAISIGGTVLLGAVALGIFFGIATLMARTTVYTITNKRIVMRFGIALPITFQFPFSQIVSADVQHLDDGLGSIVFALKEHTKISWPVLWPHVRPWKLAQPQPALRAIGNIDAVAKLLAEHLSAAHGTVPNPQVKRRSAKPVTETDRGSVTVPEAAPSGA
ncbi:MAG: photosynthetic complex putative assembly protein PuhB [Pseudomonadota bacterium]